MSAWVTGLDRASAGLRDGGVSHLLVQSARKVAFPWLEFGSLHFFVHDLGSELPQVPSSIDLRMRQAFRADFPLLLERSDPPSSPGILEERFRRGDLCFIALAADGNLAHSRWIATDRAVEVPELGKYLVLGRDDAYIYDAYTSPVFRRRGVNAAVRWFTYRWLQEAGFQRIFSYVRGDQPARVRVAQGCHLSMGTVRYLRLGRRKCWSWDSLLPGFPPVLHNSLDTAGRQRTKPLLSTP